MSERFKFKKGKEISYIIDTTTQKKYPFTSISFKDIRVLTFLLNDVVGDKDD